MTARIDPSGNAMIRRIFAGLVLLSSMLVYSEAKADFATGYAGDLAHNEPTKEQKNAAQDEQFIAKFRASPLSLTQAIGVAERLHIGSRAVAVTFEISDRPGYRVRTVKNKQVWDNFIDVITGRAIALETSLSTRELEVDELDNIMAMRSVGQELAEAVAIAEKATSGKAISGGLVKEKDQASFVILVLSEDRLKEVFLDPPMHDAQK
jgi:hypothetical protein